ncbi:MAG: hypothetical protein KBS86_03015 [Proteobacteria bacterium]|nr:hypothetical protein [Candidatus Enterousia scatequi]
MMKRIFVGLFMVMCVSPVIADSHCEDIDTYPYISHELALCSTHVYNANKDTNDGMNANDRADMNEIIALKSTIITQQLYKQYESLDKLIKKLKTQLEKAVLTANLEASGATSSKSSTGTDSVSFSSNDRNVFMAGVKNCNAEASVSAVFSCLQANYTTIYNTSGNGTKITTELRKQLANDYNLACDVTPNTDDSKGEKCEKDYLCKKATNISSRQKFQTCLDDLIIKIRNANNALANQSQQQQMMNKMFGVK